MLLGITILIPLICGLLCYAFPKRAAWERLNLLAAGLTAFLAVIVIKTVVQSGPITEWGEFFRADALSALVIGLSAFVNLVCTVYGIGYFRHEETSKRLNLRQLRQYYVLTPILVAAMLLVTVANNLGIMWVATEASTLAAVLLVALYKDKEALEAGWKYIIIGSIGISLALFGTILTYHSALGVLGTESGNGLNWSFLTGVAGKFNPTAMRLAFVMVLLGYGTKAGLVPMHTWKPDAYAQAPVPAAALLGAGVINCAIYGILRFHILASACLGPQFSGRLLVLFGVASVLLAAPFILVQRNFRRLLAYSSIEHTGMMAAAIGFGGRLGALGVTLHLFYHALCKPLMFFCAGNVQQQYGTPFLRKVSGCIKILPWTGGLFIMATFALTGMPPFGLFQSELTILAGGFSAGNWLTSGLFLLGAVTIFCGFLVHAVRINLGCPREEMTKGRECAWKLTAMVFCGVVMLVTAFWLPDTLTELIQQCVKIIGGAA